MPVEITLAWDAEQINFFMRIFGRWTHSARVLDGRDSVNRPIVPTANTVRRHNGPSYQ